MGSHTATGEWQSFEVRMRRRRAERLMVRADVALEAGFPEDARACVEEARRLAPALPDIARIEAQLAAPAVSPGAGRYRRTGRVPTGLVPGTLTLAFLVVLVAVTRSRTIPPAHDFRTSTVAPAPAPVAGFQTASIVRHAIASEKPPAAAPSIENAARPSPDRPAARSNGETPDDYVSPLPPAKPIASLRDVMPPAVPPRIETAAAESAATPAVQDGLAAAAPGAPVATAEPAEPVSTATIRAVLDRYAAAYSNLDAGAAEAVWPGVNVGALTRAFDGLATQHVSLGDCRIESRGMTAQAECAGSATWTAKIGDQSPHTEPRRWSFELARGGTAWHIVSARVQNR